MNTTAIRGRASAPAARMVLVWRWPIRLFHWSTAGAVLVLFATGLFLADPWFTAGGSTERYVMGWARRLHFTAAAVFTVAYVWRALWFCLGGPYARSGFPYVWRPAWWKELCAKAWGYLRLNVREPRVGHNALAGLSYTVFVIGLGAFQILTGLALLGQSDPGGPWDRLAGWIVPLLGSAYRTHMLHHLAAWGFGVFVVMHVYIVVLDDHHYRNGLVSSMVSGRKLVSEPATRSEGDAA